MGIYLTDLNKSAAQRIGFRNPSDGKRLAGKASGQNVVVWNIFDGDLSNVTGGLVTEVRGVGFLSVFVPLRRKDALRAQRLKRQTEAADSGEKVDESKVNRAGLRIDFDGHEEPESRFLNRRGRSDFTRGEGAHANLVNAVSSDGKTGVHQGVALCGGSAALSRCACFGVDIVGERGVGMEVEGFDFEQEVEEVAHVGGVFDGTRQLKRGVHKIFPL